MRPVILLDVDGVLNTVDHTDPMGVGFQDWEQERCNGFVITYSPEMGRRLAALDADIVWLTTWEIDDLANKEIAPLFGWDDLPILHAGQEWHRRGWRKSTVAQKFISDDPRPFVWLDEDLDYSINCGEVEWLRDVERWGIPFMTISPHYQLGLKPLHLDLIEDFITLAKDIDTWDIDT